MKRSDFLDSYDKIYSLTRGDWISPKSCYPGELVSLRHKLSSWTVTSRSDEYLLLKRQGEQFALFFDPQSETSSPDVSKDPSMHNLYQAFNDAINGAYAEVHEYSDSARTADALMIALQQRLIEMLLEKKEKEGGE